MKENESWAGVKVESLSKFLLFVFLCHLIITIYYV